MPVLQEQKPAIAARCWAGVLSIVESGALRPRRGGVTAARRGLLGAKTPWYRIRLTRGLGMSATAPALLYLLHPCSRGRRAGR